MKEQIEEMRKDLIEIFDEEYEKRRIITADFTAIKLTAKGYRKQKRGKWIYVHTYIRGRCSICNHQMQYDNQPYCANCGAKMKGANDEN